MFLQHAVPSYTVYETRQHPYSLLVALDESGCAKASIYLDDGETPDTKCFTWLSVDASSKNKSVEVKSQGSYKVEQKVTKVTVLGVKPKPSKVSVGGQKVGWKYDKDVERLTVQGLKGDLNEGWTLTWE